MTDRERLERIADLMGGVNELARAAKFSPSGICRRISGGTKISERDWLCINAAVSERVKGLTALVG